MLTEPIQAEKAEILSHTATRLYNTLLSTYAGGEIEMITREDVQAVIHRPDLATVTARWTHTSPIMRDERKSDIPQRMLAAVRGAPFVNRFESHPSGEELSQWMMFVFSDKPLNPEDMMSLMQTVQ